MPEGKYHKWDGEDRMKAEMTVMDWRGWSESETSLGNSAKDQVRNQLSPIDQDRNTRAPESDVPIYFILEDQVRRC
jgi:hypothetical protein